LTFLRIKPYNLGKGREIKKCFCDEIERPGNKKIG
jgi:hypothetical protein